MVHFRPEQWFTLNRNKWFTLVRNNQVTGEFTNIELGNDTIPQLYNLKDDIGEKNNLATINPEKVNELADLLKQVRDNGRSR